MEVSVNAESGLQRQMTVTVPAERVNRELNERLRRLAREVNLPGFRPGKVPIALMEQKYGERVYEEVKNRLVSETYSQALEEQALNPVAQPDLKAGELKRNSDFAYTATFEVYPEIAPQGYKGLAIAWPTAEVDEAVVDKTLARLREAQATYELVERAAEEGDQLVVDFVGRIEGESFEGGQASDYTLELGAGRHLEALEEGLKGTLPRETRTVTVPFPADYPREELAGRTAEFEVVVKSVQEKRIPALDEAFVRSFGVEDGSIETLREEVRHGLEREIQEKIRHEVRRQLFDQLAEQAEFEVPEQLVARQLEQLVQSHQDQYRQQGLDPETLDLDTQSLRDRFRDEAIRQVKIGLLIPEIARAEGLEVSQDELRQKVEQLAEQYGDQRDQFLRWVSQNREQMQEIEGRVLETKVVDWLLKYAQVTEEAVSAGALLGWEQDETREEAEPERG